MTPSPALLALANAIPSVLWSVLSLVPIGVYCYQHMAGWPFVDWLLGCPRRGLATGS